MSENKINYDQAKFIKEYDNYLLFANGNILNCNSNKWVKGYKDKEGKIKIEISKNNKNKSFYIHRLISEYFINNPNNYRNIEHINNIMDDNRLNNLRWVKATEKQKDTLPEYVINREVKYKNSGYTGVHFVYGIKAWRAKWYDENDKIKSKTFYISKYGDEEALKKAIETRKEANERNKKYREEK